MKINKIELVKKNFYLAIFVVVLLFAIGFVIAAYDASKASHETLYTNRIEPKTGLDIVLSPLGNIGIGVDTPSAKLDVAGEIKSNGKLVCLVNGTNCPVSAQGKWDGNKPGNIYYNDGNVGIGTATPQAKLEVNGWINVTAGNDVCIKGGNCLGGHVHGFDMFTASSSTTTNSVSISCPNDGVTIRVACNGYISGGVVGSSLFAGSYPSGTLGCTAGKAGPGTLYVDAFCLRMDNTLP